MTYKDKNKEARALYNSDHSRYEAVSLLKLLKSPIKDITGYISNEFAYYGGDAVFKLNAILLEDGTEFGVEGEHDIAYLVSGYLHPAEFVVPLEDIVEDYGDDD